MLTILNGEMAPYRSRAHIIISCFVWNTERNCLRRWWRRSDKGRQNDLSAQWRISMLSPIHQIIFIVSSVTLSYEFLKFLYTFFIQFLQYFMHLMTYETIMILVIYIVSLYNWRVIKNEDQNHQFIDIAFKAEVLMYKKEVGKKLL